MKILRLVLSLVILGVAAPLFALPQCSSCNYDTFNCQLDAGPGVVCYFGCIERFQNCSPAYAPVLASELTIVSVEVVTPQRHTVTTNAKTVRVAAAKVR